MTFISFALVRLKLFMKNALIPCLLATTAPVLADNMQQNFTKLPTL